jgi:hypothetical protein
VKELLDLLLLFRLLLLPTLALCFFLVFCALDVEPIRSKLAILTHALDLLERNYIRTRSILSNIKHDAEDAQAALARYQSLSLNSREG